MNLSPTHRHHMPRIDAISNKLTAFVGISSPYILICEEIKTLSIIWNQAKSARGPRSSKEPAGKLDRQADRHLSTHLETRKKKREGSSSLAPAADRQSDGESSIVM